MHVTQLDDLRMILREWTRMVEAYSNDVDPADALYWYNERATLSTLAAAAARVDCYVLEEYRTPKLSQDRQWSGRADLWIRSPRSEYILEAKQLLVLASSEPSGLAGTIDSALATACADADCHPLDPKYCMLGVVFIVPYIPKARHRDRDTCVSMLETALADADLDVSALAVPKRASPINDQGYLYPAVACCMRRVRVSNPYIPDTA